MKNKGTKIVHIIDHLGAGGTQKLLVELVKHIDKEKYNISIIILRDENLYSMVLQKLGVSVHPVSSRKSSIGIKRLIAILQKEPPDVVHTHLFKANLLGQYAAKKLMLPRIAHMHSTFNPRALLPFFFQNHILLSLYQFLLRYVLRGATRIITTSENDRKFLIERWGFQPVQVLYLPNGVSLEPSAEIQKNRQKYRKKVRALSGIKEEVPVIGMVGRLSKEKNWPLFFSTAAAIKKELSEAVFWVVGDGKEREEYKKLVKELELEFSVHFWGYYSDTPEIYCGMDCFLFTSALDSCSLVLMEAMLAKLPVVAISSEAAKSIITHRKNGILIEDNNPEAIARAVIELLPDKELKARITAQGYEYCITRFDIRHWVSTLANLYAELASHLVRGQ
jgi:glycosyltransferase involved in cell wall biosynthesis